MIEVFNSFLLVFVSEMGDKTQLLALILAARYKKPFTIMLGIFVATLLNHALASWAGSWLSSLVSHQTLVWILAGTFFAFSIWILIPDKESEIKESGAFGAFMTTVITFFLAEMGDKTQLATIALGAKYSNLFLVTLGTTLGLLASDALAVFMGNQLLKRIPMKWVRAFASFIFFLFGAAILIDHFKIF